jgi:hypothetical protein
MKPWTAYPEAFTRATIAAHCGSYSATYPTKEEANAACRLLQKFAAAVRRDPGAPLELRFAAANAEGGVRWSLPRLDNGSWLVLGAPRGKSKADINSVGASLT